MAAVKRGAFRAAYGAPAEVIAGGGGTAAVALSYGAARAPLPEGVLRGLSNAYAVHARAGGGGGSGGGGGVAAAAAELSRATLQALSAEWAGAAGADRAAAAALRGERWLIGSGGGSQGRGDDHATLRSLAAAWAFADVCFARASIAPGSVRAALSAWLRDWAPALRGGQSRALTSIAAFAEDAEKDAGVPAEAHASYWPAVCACCALGWHAQALELLGLHSVWEQPHTPEVLARLEALEPVSTLLTAVPKLEDDEAPADDESTAAARAHQAAHYREAWRQQVAGVFASSHGWGALDEREREGLRAVLRVLAGERDALLTAGGGGWLDAMVASAVHAWPALAAPTDLPAHAAEVLRAVGQGGAKGSEEERGVAGALESFMRACVMQDGQTAIRVAGAAFPPVFAVHLAELLHAFGDGQDAVILSRALNGPLGATLPECLRTQHVLALGAAGAAGELAEPYLQKCPTVCDGLRQAMATRTH